MLTSLKTVKSPSYNYIFDPRNGDFARWGKTLDDDPLYSPLGPEIMDIEVSTICHRACSHCYKSNMSEGRNMSFETFQRLFAKFPKNLTQIAFGIGDIDANPDLWKMMIHSRQHGVIPNLTINGYRMQPMHFKALGAICGAVAVSLYDKETCYNVVSLLSTYVAQCNIHVMLSEETYHLCQQVVVDYGTDERLKNIHAIIFLRLKPKGERNTYHQVKADRAAELIDLAVSRKVPIGFDSCSAPLAVAYAKGKPIEQEWNQVIEPCESTMFSYYINTDGMGFPCSFTEGVFTGINILEAGDFMKDVWFHPDTVVFRERALACQDTNGCRKCSIFDLEA